MSDDDETPLETPLPKKMRKLEEKLMALESPGSGSHHLSCTAHSGFEKDIENLKEAVLAEERKREQAFTALSGKLDGTNDKLGELNTTVAKWGGIAAFALVVIQIAVPILMKFVGG